MAYNTILEFLYTRFHYTSFYEQVFTNKVPQVTTSVYKNALQASEALQPYFKESEGISRTSLRRGVLTRFAVKDFFSYKPLKARKKKNLVQTSYLQEE
jgi:hypothetical protein